MATLLTNDSSDWPVQCGRESERFAEAERVLLTLLTDVDVLVNAMAFTDASATFHVTVKRSIPLLEGRTILPP